MKNSIHQNNLIETSKILSQSWKELNPEKKQIYIDKSKEMKKNYDLFKNKQNK